MIDIITHHHLPSPQNSLNTSDTPVNKSTIDREIKIERVNSYHHKI